MEFYKYPDLMAQFPFAHIHEVTYRLKGGKLECATKITNVGNSNMPVHFGYHPYFVPDGPREQWTLHVAAKQHWVVPPELIPTGELEPAEKYLPGCTGALTLGNTYIDAGFTDLVRDKDGLARFWVAGATTKMEVVFGPEFTTAVCYAPSSGNTSASSRRQAHQRLQPEARRENFRTANPRSGKDFPGVVLVCAYGVLREQFQFRCLRNDVANQDVGLLNAWGFA